MGLDTFRDDVFALLATSWKLTAVVIDWKVGPCCTGDPTCRDITESFTVEICRSGAEPIRFESAWAMGDMVAEDFTPAFALSDLADRVAGIHGETTQEEDAAIEVFLWSGEGSHIWLRHFRSLALTANALDYFISDDDGITAVLCN